MPLTWIAGRGRVEITEKSEMGGKSERPLVYKVPHFLVT